MLNRAVVLASVTGEAGMEPAVGVLRSGGEPIDAVEAGVRAVETDPRVSTAGARGWPNVTGSVECDAAVMEGAGRRLGAVGALRGFRHPVSVARQVLERSPHVFLAGEGARRFAREMGAEPEGSRSRWLGPFRERVRGLGFAPEELRRPGAALLPAVASLGRKAFSKGTTAFLARDREGRFAAATSTSGWPCKYPGRLGDSPVSGAGLYADDRAGAVACTHTGEMTIRSGTARLVVLLLSQGLGPEEAVRAAFADLARLAGGTLGPVVVHAMGRDGTVFVGSTAGPIGYWLWREGEAGPERREAAVIDASG